jgi:putative membrane protein insertion efficiency factor
MSVATSEHLQVEAPSAPGTPGLVARGLLAVVRWYQAFRAGRPTGCRFVPTCSEFAADAITRRGAMRGTLLAAGRVARCGPWGGHGFDPVPDRRSR